MGVHEDNPWATEAEEGGGKKRQDILGMTWKQGDHTLRICPSTKQGGLPFVKYIVHWIPSKTSVKNRPIVHDVKYKCPVCEYVGSLWSEVYRLKEEENMTDESPEVKKLIKQINTFRGKKTYDMNVIHREDLRKDDGKIKIKRLVAGPTIWKPIIELGNSSKWGNPSSAGNRGYDFTVTVTGEKIKREYTILPDSERKALTEEELQAVKDSAYDLVKLRTFSSVEEMIDIIEGSKPPLDTISLKKLKRQLKEVDDDEGGKSSAPAATDDDATDTDVATPAAANANDEDDRDATPPPADDETEAAVADDGRDAGAFSSTETPEAESSEAEGTSEETVTLEALDCRGTYDGEDVGCQECPFVDQCQELKATFKAKAKELNISIANMSGVEIEKLIKEKEKEKAAAAKSPVGKQGKVGKQGSSAPAPAPEKPATPAAAATPPKRKLPF